MREVPARALVGLVKVPRPFEQRRALSLGAVTLLLGLAFLMGQRYTVERCFRTAAMSGCERPVFPFSLEALPSLAIPLALVVLLALTAGLSASGGSPLMVAASTTVHGAGAAILVLGGGFILLFPLIGTLAIALDELGRPRRRILQDLGGAGAIAIAGAAAAYGVLVAAMYLRGGFLGAAAPLIAIYLAYVVVVGLALGLTLALRDRSAYPMTRAMAAAALAAGVAGTLALFLVPPVVGRAVVVPGVPLLGALGVASGTVAAGWLLDLPPLASLGLASAVAVGLAPFLLAALLVLFGFSGPLSLMPPLPHVPWLPGTSTAP
jgi:hypothetical protein